MTEYQHLNADVCLPIIGILCVDIAQALQQLYGSENHSYLDAAYVKYLEAAGAKVIPIWQVDVGVIYIHTS